MRKAIEEAKKFVCTTKDRIVKDAKEFIQNVDWKKVAIGVAGTLAVAAVVVATGGAAAPVLIGAAAGAGISTGTTVVSGVIQGKSPAEIAKDASGAFMWGAIGGAVGGGTTEVFKDVGSNVLGKVGKKLVEDGVDMALDLTQTATEIQIVLQKKGSSSSHLYHVVIDKDGNFKEMYSGYAGDVIKDDNYFEVITE